MKFAKEYFTEQQFTEETISKLRGSAVRDIKIAENDKEPEVRFHFSYMALLKTGVLAIAMKGYRIKSKPGHHKIILETLSNILDDKDILIAGDRMRKNLNFDVYSGSITINSEEIEQNLKFVKEVFTRATK